MVPDLTIRRARPDDVPEIRQVARSAWREAYGGFVDDAVLEELLADGYATEFLEAAIDSPEVAIFVATDAYSVVGYVSCEPPSEGSVGQVSIYVSPDYWGEGIGTELLDRAEAHLDGEATALRDVVLAANDAGNAFYRKHFERTDETTVEMGGEEFDANVYTAEL